MCATTVCHELRNPLHVLKSCVHSLRPSAVHAVDACESASIIDDALVAVGRMEVSTDALLYTFSIYAVTMSCITRCARDHVV